MPANVVTNAREERLWSEAKAQVKKEYPDVSEGDERFYKLVMGIFKRMRDRTGGGEPVAKAVLRIGGNRTTLGMLRWFLKAMQFAMPFHVPDQVQSPGSHGGTYYRDEKGHVRYGVQKNTGFKLNPPEVGETKSGKPVPHPDDPNARGHAGNAYHWSGSAFRGWSREDHADAARVHREYVEHHRKRNNHDIAAKHAAAARAHEAAGGATVRLERK